MLTKMTIRNFKKFKEEIIELGNPVVFIGPNDSGKTSALQALALWDIGLKKWVEKREGKPTPKTRPAVTINRKDLLSIPVREASHLWRNLSLRKAKKTAKGPHTENIRIDIMVEGVSGGTSWACGLEYDYANEEAFYCRPLRTSEGDRASWMPIPEEAKSVQIAYLPPMSGLTSVETRLDPGAINVRVGEGRTAEVLRNLCYLIRTNEKTGEEDWRLFCNRVDSLFGVKLDEPNYLRERGEITLSYRDHAGTRLDIGCSGRGLQQTMLLLAHLVANQGSILLLDEPDAHLEILRQRQIYQVLSEWAREYNGQIVIASHSEVVLNEAADRDVVIAFLGKAHRIDDRGSQVLKALKEIGFEHYYQAEQKGWVLYLEGSTDLAILQALAKKLGHPAQQILERPFAEYVGNQPSRAYAHFYGLREAKRDLLGIGIWDRLDKAMEEKAGLRQMMWRRMEIENYICQTSTLQEWANDFGARSLGGDLFGHSAKTAMEESIKEIEAALNTLGKSPWSPETKASDEFLKPLFERFFRKLNLPNIMSKSSYYELAAYVPKGEIDGEVKDVLDAISEVAQKAKPTSDEET